MKVFLEVDAVEALTSQQTHTPNPCYGRAMNVTDLLASNGGGVKDIAAEKNAARVSVDSVYTSRSDTLP